MRIPKRLQPLIDEGLVDEVIRPITAGKEAEVFLVRSHGVLRAAKVYKEATQRSFKQRADYLDGRKLGSSRGERARARGGRFAREQEEEAWQTAELVALGKLVAAGVRVPHPRGFMDGVLLMDLVLTADGEPAPRIADCDFSGDEARVLFEGLVHEVQRMLCVGIVHGDLSEYNVLLSAWGPVVIDLPQMVDAAASRGARRLLVRDVGNLRAFCARFAPELAQSRFAEEMWGLWERAQLTPDTRLTGRWRESARHVDVERVRSAIHEAERDRARMLEGRAQGPKGPRGPRPPQGGDAGAREAQAPRAPQHAQAPRAPQQAPAPRAPQQAHAPRPPQQAQAPRPPQAHAPRAPQQAQAPRPPQAHAPRPPQGGGSRAPHGPRPTGGSQHPRPPRGRPG